jgi:hypothetical protein
VSEPARVVTWVSALIVLAVPTRGAACQCVVFPADTALIARVQSSWAPARRWVAAGQYARALREVRLTAGFVRRIQDAPSRRCVAAGAENLIASATAGKAYLARHPSDAAGARAAASRAWQTFVDCR